MPDGPIVLPSFKGYTVDERLHQFRKVDREQGIEFVSFDSEEGKVLLLEWYRSEEKQQQRAPA